MGWSAHKLPNKNWNLWTRGGTEGVYIKENISSAIEIDIPSELLRMLVAKDIRSHRIAQLEQMNSDELLSLK